MKKAASSIVSECKYNSKYVGIKEIKSIARERGIYESSSKEEMMLVTFLESVMKLWVREVAE